jgi:hypothetical protein
MEAGVVLVSATPSEENMTSKVRSRPLSDTSIEGLSVLSPRNLRFGIRHKSASSGVTEEFPLVSSDGQND